MVKQKPLQRKTDGWVYFVQWSSMPWMVKIGFTTSPQDRFASFLTCSADTLVVLKIFQSPREMEKDLHARFDAARERREWFRLSAAIKRYLQEEAPCQTLEAKVKFGKGMEDDVKWVPMRQNTSVLLEAMKQEQRIPGFIKNARLYTLWAIDDLDTCDYFVTSNAIIHHEANRDIYKAKTIYNQLMDLEEEKLIAKRKDKTFSVTEEGKLELENAELDHAEAKPRKSAKSLRLS